MDDTEYLSVGLYDGEPVVWMARPEHRDQPFAIPLRWVMGQVLTKDPANLPAILAMADAAWPEIGPVMATAVRQGYPPYAYGALADRLLDGLVGVCGRRRLALLIAQAMDADAMRRFDVSDRIDRLLARGRAMPGIWRRRHGDWLVATVVDTAAKRGDLTALAALAGAA